MKPDWNDSEHTWSRKDLVQLMKDYLVDNLRISVDTGDWCNPNSRKVIVSLNEEELCYDYFDIVQQREYEG